MLKLIAAIFLLIVLLNPIMMAWIAREYVVDDGLTPADVVVALRGDTVEENFRMEEAARLLTEGYARKILVDVNSRPFFLMPEARLVEEYLKQKGVSPQQMELCENRADSTDEEAVALRGCLQRIGAKKVIIVTSEYHTRRARVICRHELAGTGIEIRMHAVYNPEYWDAHWWRKRRWAKTFFIETVKTFWTEIELAVSRLKASSQRSAFSRQRSATELAQQRTELNHLLAALTKLNADR